MKNAQAPKNLKAINTAEEKRPFGKLKAAEHHLRKTLLLKKTTQDTSTKK